LASKERCRLVGLVTTLKNETPRTAGILPATFKLLTIELVTTIAGWKPAVLSGTTSSMQHAGWRSRGYLPHCDSAALTQHIVMSCVGANDGVEAHFGQHLLASDTTASLVERALLYFDGERYRILGWCVMPNHVHVVVEQSQGWPLSSVVHSWKSFTANAINRVLRRSGQVWHREYFDRYMRDDDHVSATIFYVENNPVDAGLVDRAELWKWSSARLR
jgi:putative transposase